MSAIRQYLYFTNYFKLEQLPASVDTIVCFLEFMARTSGYDHIKHLYSSVKYLHVALDYSFPENSFQVDTTLQGLKRRLANVPFQVLPLTPQILRRIYRHMNMNSAEDRALWCAYLCSFYGLLRKANAVPESVKFDPRKILVKRNITVDLPTTWSICTLALGRLISSGLATVSFQYPAMTIQLLTQCVIFTHYYQNHQHQPTLLPSVTVPLSLSPIVCLQRDSSPSSR